MTSTTEDILLLSLGSFGILIAMTFVGEVLRAREAPGLFRRAAFAVCVCRLWLGRALCDFHPRLCVLAAAYRVGLAG